ncbi:MULTISPECIES: DUF4148 domain-containing protein [Comamonadaceae]|uniref:DUF4148 domain-containing protein n=2 Tax=Comamonadaceae TaxID=80864 RepID=F4G9Z3_ALIDK|nr:MULTISPECIES: DUF4148 domain-containing protein [Comamonadaceae]ACM33643.1 conserved hypothetical protein [[Acidovorax] ebreus TPSY]AEB85725.1 hypothetical protein Alide2_3392 [Alicycliphilus denitrificans K601]
MTQRRLSLSAVIASVATVAAFGLPGMASAEYMHPANNQAGVVVHNEHFKSEKTREQVRAETEAAMRQGPLSYGESNFPRGAKAAPSMSSKTRQQVIDEMRNETPAQREARQLLYPAG